MLQKTLLFASALVLPEGISRVELLSADVSTAVFEITFVDYPAGP